MLHDDDAVLNTAGERPFSELVVARLSRRDVLGGGLAAAAAFLAGGTLLGGVAEAHQGAPPRGRGRGRDGRDHKGGRGRGQRPRELLGFAAIPLGFDDEVDVSPGYTAKPFIPWGTPILGSFPAFVPGTPPLVPGGNTADQQAEQMGMDHDAMHYFPLERGPGGSERGLLVVNQENTHEGYLHTGTEQVPARSAWTEEMVRKSQNAHGVTVVEIARTPPASGRWCGRGATAASPPTRP